MKTVTGIHGVPRSGTSWLAQLFNASPEVCLKFQPMFSYAFKGKITKGSESKDISNFFNEIYHSNDDFINMRDTELLKSYPKFKKNDILPHLVFKHVRYHNLLPHLLGNNNALKIILIIRNPMAVINSWYYAPREFNVSWNLDEEWEFAIKKNQNRTEEYFGYRKWKEAAKLFLRLEFQFPERVKVIRYIDLLNNTKNIVSNLYEFIGIDLSQQTISFIEESKTKEFGDPNSVYRVKHDDNSYLNILPKHIVSQITYDLLGTELERFLD